MMNDPQRARRGARPRLSGFVRVLILLAVLLSPVNVVWAHGGGALQIANEPVGDCLASVWLAPSTPRANKTLHVTVGLAEAVDGAPVLDGKVLVEITDTATDEQVAAAPATTAQSANRLFYEADLPPLTVGEYLFTVTTTCQGAMEELTFVAEIRPSTNPLLIALPLATGGMLIGVWLWRQWRGQGTAVPPIRKHTASQ